MDFRYERFKKFFEEHKNRIVLTVSFVLVFLSGFGAGKYDKTYIQKQKAFSNYSTKPSVEQKIEPLTETKSKTGETDLEQAVLSAATSTKAGCLVKGNISASSKIYHVAGGAFYKTVKPEMCFNSEAEALAAGFRKSNR